MCLVLTGVLLLVLVIGGTIWFRRRNRRRQLEENGKFISPGDNQQQLLPGYQLGQQQGDGQQGMAHGSEVGESMRRSTDENEWCADCLDCVASSTVERLPYKQDVATSNPAFLKYSV